VPNPIYSQALDVVDEDADIWNYVYVANFAPPDLTSHRPLLVKLSPNNPPTNPFDPIWAKYLTVSTAAGDPLPELVMEAKDVHYVKSFDEYIICGKITNSLEYNGSFLILTNAAGNPTTSKLYRGITDLRSVVANHDGRKGYVAVGVSKSGAAAFLSVDASLDVVCAQELNGEFDTSDTVSSEFNKVIQYRSNQFAMAGATTKDRNNCEVADTNVLVAIMKKNCAIKRKGHYGSSPYLDTSQNPPINVSVNEIGMALVERKRPGGRGLFITGITRKAPLCDTTAKPIFEDILVFRLKRQPNFLVAWMHHFDVDNAHDIGLAIDVEETLTPKRVLVAGQSKNRFLNDAITTPPKDDVFLLDLRYNAGTYRNFELFGKNDHDGGLYPGNLDLHLSQDKHAIILGNTRSFGNNSQRPYLIEHYFKKDEVCYDIEVDVDDNTYDFPQFDVTLEDLEPAEDYLFTESHDAKIDNKIICAKVPT